jgi:hypothetical protein
MWRYVRITRFTEIIANPNNLVVHVRFWHVADMSERTANVCLRSKADMTLCDAASLTESHGLCIVGDNCETRLCSGLGMRRFVSDHQSGTWMHQRCHAPRYIGGQVDSVHRFGSNKG